MPAPALMVALSAAELSMLLNLVRRRLQAIAVHANLCDQHGADYPQAVSASKERKRLRALLVKLGDESVLDEVE